MATEKYDEDARMLESVSDAETDSTSDDTLVQSPSARDRDVLNDHDQEERLLLVASSSKKKGSKDLSHRPRQRGRRRRKSSVNGEASNLVYEMEEGYNDNSASTSTDSLMLGSNKFQKSKTICSSHLCLSLMSVSIAILFAILAYGAYHASKLHRTADYIPQVLNNGTHEFQPTTILISLDGFRADFLQRGLTPSMNAFVASGASPKYMLPSFPSVTFPNHYTLVTGLYPESHGIVSNQFWDPSFEEEFYYTNTSSSMQSKWWEAAEPLWMTAENQGIKTAIHMWPGSEAHIHGVEPSYLDTFDAHEQLPKKIDRMLGLIDMDQTERPQLIAAYVPDVDRDGHKFGPNSTEIHATIASADNMLTLLMEGLLARNLTEIVNLVVVSDHGMATMSAHRMVQLDDLIDMEQVDHIDGWPLRGLRLKNPDRDVPIMYEQLSKASQSHGTFDVYTLDTMPERYHFSNNPRIAPLWVVPKTGWLVIEKADFDIAAAIEAKQEFHPRGIHGFDHEHPLMRAIFIARGPAFPHAPNSRLPVFQNIEVYNIVCDSLGISPHANNGTLRLPLKIEGLHTDFDEPVDPPKDDPADIHDVISTSPPPSSTSTPTDIPPSPDIDSSVPAAEVESAQKSKASWLDYLHNQLDKAKEWAKDIIDSIKNNKEDAGHAEAG